MKNRFETAYDTNPARIKILIKRNRKNNRLRRAYLAGLFSSTLMVLVWGATHVLS